MAWQDPLVYDTLRDRHSDAAWEDAPAAPRSTADGPALDRTSNRSRGALTLQFGHDDDNAAMISEASRAAMLFRMLGHGYSGEEYEQDRLLSFYQSRRPRLSGGGTETGTYSAV